MQVGLHLSPAGLWEITRERPGTVRSRQGISMNARCREWHARSRHQAVWSFCFSFGCVCGCTGPFAGSPAPTSTPRPSNLWCTCGSGQAREKGRCRHHHFLPATKKPRSPGASVARRLPTPARYARSVGPATGKRGSPARHGRPRTRVHCGTSRCWPPHNRSPTG